MMLYLYEMKANLAGMKLYLWLIELYLGQIRPKMNCLKL
jgi:hypothetical protein